MLARLKHKLRWRAKHAANAAIGMLAVTLLRVARYFDPDKLANFGAALTRRIGPLFKENKIARDNLRAAFPEKSPQEIENILSEVWSNLGRFGAEFAHLDHIWDLDPHRDTFGRIEVSPRTIELFQQLQNDGKGALIFAAHIGNWELPALAGPAYGLDSAVLFRRPNIAAVDKAVMELRAVNMGMLIATTMDAPLKLAEALRRGTHVGMLVDQHFGRGVDVTMFGRPAKANPLLARLARQVECPIHGVRIIRLPDHRFRAELTEELTPVRDADGAIDVQATTQAISNVIEGWVREYPAQWLWLHRRWR